MFTEEVAKKTPIMCKEHDTGEVLFKNPEDVYRPTSDEKGINNPTRLRTDEKKVKAYQEWIDNPSPEHPLPTIKRCFRMIKGKVYLWELVDGFHRHTAMERNQVTGYWFRVVDHTDLTTRQIIGSQLKQNDHKDHEKLGVNGVANALYKVFVEKEEKEIELAYLQQLSEDEANKKYKVRVTDKNGRSYVRFADRAKITELRQNPNIESVEMTEHGEPYEGERKKGQMTARAKAGKKLDPVGKEDKDIDNDGDHDKTDKYLLKRRKAIGSAIRKRADKKIKEAYLADGTISTEPKNPTKITGKGVDNYATGAVKISPDDGQTDPAVKPKGVYSHFAESDNTENSNFTNSQLKTFLDVCSKISERVSGSFIRHMSNSDGLLNFPKSQLDMVRLGLVVYGISNNTKINRSLTSVIKWSSQVAQIKTVKKGETVGYGRAYIAKNEMRIAVIPVGYADGFRRSLGNGKGSVFIKGQVFYTVGNVCMDMIMIDISNEDVLPGDLVEIIGEHQSLIQFARLLDTIPYEVLTSLSDRVHRNYIIN